MTKSEQKKKEQIQKKIALFKTASEQGLTVDEYLEKRNGEAKEFLQFMGESIRKLSDNGFFSNEKINRENAVKEFIERH